MTATCYVTFGQKYRRETHPVDVRVSPDGWFEYVAPTWAEASTAARRHLADLHSGEYADRPDPGFYPRGCLARFAVVDGTAQEAQR